MKTILLIIMLSGLAVLCVTSGLVMSSRPNREGEVLHGQLGQTICILASAVVALIAAALY